MAEKKSPLLIRLKKSVTKLTAVLRLCVPSRRPPRRRRSISSDCRTLGLRSFLEDEIVIVEDGSVRRLDRAPSLRSASARFEDDIDKRSQIFIDNFRRQLRLERQISLQLRYYRINSSETNYDQRSPP